LISVQVFSKTDGQVSKKKKEKEKKEKKRKKKKEERKKETYRGSMNSEVMLYTCRQ